MCVKRPQNGTLAFDFSVAFLSKKTPRPFSCPFFSCPFFSCPFSVALFRLPLLSCPFQPPQTRRYPTNKKNTRARLGALHPRHWYHPGQNAAGEPGQQKALEQRPPKLCGVGWGGGWVGAVGLGRWGWGGGLHPNQNLGLRLVRESPNQHCAQLLFYVCMVLGRPVYYQVLIMTPRTINQTRAVYLHRSASAGVCECVEPPTPSSIHD